MLGLLAQPSRRILPVAARWARFNSSHISTEGAQSVPPAQVEPQQPIPFTEADYASTIIHGRSLYPPYYHPRTHNIPVALIHFRSYHPLFLDLFVHFAGHAAGALSIPVSRPIYLPTQRSMWTVPRGPFAHKKSQENFERKVHKRAIKAWDADPEVIERWVKYLQRHTMAGVGMRVTKWKRAPMDIGARMLQDAMGQLRLDTDAQKVKALGEQISQKELAVAEDPRATLTSSPDVKP
ncbi:hypothetical protein SERLA73DRAFT_92601 [Serpula lacrymans var. lacrymans S7.3]|uniref:Small ribosomal subunit protein uS10m n=2 Tax=Serpula lacrymans var. lacrymans TaxID=341189 RepID=F8Q2S0_SERL3|nr:uncharacterized protein SERLADRAFT_356965 [Serpula lacrymans var. lacrymans S7.9]EGN97481.1 hypothetical protein SERLA73DRAFT_92601 [Serpula lacrymans var. lacrymans S7.3]EGO23078.1 hypothetical protein SERLADRAFT_356965 [Serpula lacrymans var. lacrymans S7.9]